jgi:hypothetical protein
MIRVAYVGNFAPPHSTENMVKAALEANGCTVFPVQQDEAFRAGLTDNVKQNIDLLIYTRSHNRSALHSGWTDVWRQLETRHGVVTASLHLDRFWDLEREKLIHAHDPLFTTQHVWTADGGNDDRWREAGVNHHWLVPAVDGRAIRDETVAVREAPEILFVGSTGYHREYPQRDQLVQHLARTYGPRFMHFGKGGTREVRGPALTALYRSAKVVVGDSCFANDRTPRRSVNYFSDRIPETLGRGGFLIHPWVPGLSSQYDTGRHLVTHVPGDWDDLDAQIGQYLASPGVAEGIADTGRAHVLRAHTWDVRIRELLDVLGFRDDRIELDA